MAASRYPYNTIKPFHVPPRPGRSVLSDSDLPIRYALVIEDREDREDEHTYRVGLSSTILSLLPRLQHILHWPRSCTELRLSRDELIADRIVGWAPLLVEHIRLSLLPQRLAERPGDIWCLLTSKDVASAVRKLAAKTESAVVHVSVPGEGEISYNAVDRASLGAQIAAAWIRAAKRAGLKGKNLKQLEKAAAGLKQSTRPLSKLPIQLPALDIDSLGPSRLALGSVEILAEGTPPREVSPERLVELILAFAREIDTHRARVLEAHPNLARAVVTDLVIGAPAMMRERYLGGKRIRPEATGAAPDLEGLFRAIREQRGYFLKPPKEFALDQASDVAIAALQLYFMEQRAFSTALGALASADFAPVLPLPPAVNHLRTPADTFAHWVRSSAGRPNSRQSEKAAELGTALWDAIPEPLRPLIASRTGAVRIFADAPLEWTCVEGFPLMLRAYCSRIPVTPGDLGIAVCTFVEPLEIPASGFAEILVVRALDPTDDLYPVLRNELESLQDSGALVHTRFRFVDVVSREEFIETVQEFRGAMMIFDGHGGRSTLVKPLTSEGVPAITPGVVEIGSELVELWTLHEMPGLRVPPVVVLSACDTHALDTYHPSVGSAFLAAGAVTVLATTLPVLGTRAAHYVRHLVVQLELLQASLADGSHPPIRWTAFACRAQRIAYADEMLDVVFGGNGKRLQAEARKRLLDEAIWNIMTDVTDWLGQLLAAAAAATGQTSNAVRERAQKIAYYTDSLAYLQLGRPELIGIVAKRED